MGHPAAQHELAMLLLERTRVNDGGSMASDEEKAEMWLRRASNQYHTGATVSLCVSCICGAATALVSMSCCASGVPDC
eukprot:4321733-Prymnesium_polylepis.1